MGSIIRNLKRQRSLHTLNSFSQEEEVQGRRSRNPSFSKSINPQPTSNRRGGRRSRTASEGDSWTVVSSDNQQRSVHSQGQHLYSGRHSSGGMGTSVTNNSNSKTNYSFAKVQPYQKVLRILQIHDSYSGYRMIERNMLICFVFSNFNSCFAITGKSKTIEYRTDIN